MPFDPEAAERLRTRLARRRGVTEKKMFGGIGFLLHGHICVGVWKDSLIVRVGPEAYPDALREPGARDFDITGRPMKGWVMIAPEGYEDDDELDAWVARAWKFVSKLPRKP